VIRRPVASVLFARRFSRLHLRCKRSQTRESACDGGTQTSSKVPTSWDSQMQNAFRGNTFVSMPRCSDTCEVAKNTFSPFPDLRRHLGMLFGMRGGGRRFRKKKLRKRLSVTEPPSALLNGV